MSSLNTSLVTSPLSSTQLLKPFDFSFKSPKPLSDDSERDPNFIRLETKKRTYPMCVASYEPLNVLVFALVNRQLLLY